MIQRFLLKPNPMRTGIIISFVVAFIFAFGCESEDTLNNPDGVTFTNITGNAVSGYTLKGNIVSYREILGYDSARHIFLLAARAGKRVRNKDYPVGSTHFAIAVDDKLIYVASFIPAYSSMSCIDCIAVDPYSYNNKYRFSLGYPYPGSDKYFPHPDPRNDKRIISRIAKDNKLTDIDPLDD